jgi:pimeloyl-ACP methyl ester carboxylesterase
LKPRIATLCLLAISFTAPIARSSDVTTEPRPAPKPIGTMVDVSGHRLHFTCLGDGSPTVVIESGFDEYSFDWILVQAKASAFTRVCAYDRAGYAWSDPGPKPRTFAQINLELRDALAKLGEKPPFILVGHSFGGPVARNFALTYPDLVAGIVFVDAASEEQRYTMQHKAIPLRDGATGKPVPAPHTDMLESDQPKPPDSLPPAATTPDPPFDRLPPQLQKLHVWADSQPAMYDAEESERTWSPEYFKHWYETPQTGSLGFTPLIVLMRAEGGYTNDLDVSATTLESERKQAHAHLAALSLRGRLQTVPAGHNMQVEAPDTVSDAIKQIVTAARHDPMRNAKPSTAKRSATPELPEFCF